MNYETAATMTSIASWNAMDCRLTTQVAKALFMSLYVTTAPVMEHEYTNLPLEHETNGYVFSITEKIQTSHKVWEAMKVVVDNANRTLTFTYFDMFEVTVADHGVDPTLTVFVDQQQFGQTASELLNGLEGAKAVLEADEKSTNPAWPEYTALKVVDMLISSATLAKHL